MARSDGEHNTDKGKGCSCLGLDQKLESGQISTIINAASKKGGMEGHVLSTIFRKSAVKYEYRVVTSVHQNHKKMKRRLADLMEHKDSTATRFYHLHEKQGTCLEAGSNLSKIKTAHEKTPASVIKRSNLKEKKSAFVLEGRTGGSPKGTYG